MTFLLLLPTFLSALLMAAHFLRASSTQSGLGARIPAAWDLFMFAMSLLLPLLLLVRRRVVLRAMQLFLFLAALELLSTGWDIMQRRMADRNPDVLLPGLIMAASAAFCLLAAALYQTPRLKSLFPRDPSLST